MDAGDWLAFFGNALGGLIGVFAAFKAVHWQRESGERTAEKTIKALNRQLFSSAELLEQLAATRPSTSARSVYRAFCALRDVAIGVRTNNATVAVVAARLEHTTAFSGLQRLIEAPENGIAATDATAIASEIKGLCADIDRYFDDPKSVRP